jgi:hypothetical protein
MVIKPYTGSLIIFFLFKIENLTAQKLLFLMTIERRNKFKEQFITKFT